MQNPTDLKRHPRFVDALVARLDRLAARGRLDAESIAAALEGDLDPCELRPWTAFHADNYRRNLVFRRDAFEVRVLCWLPGQRTSLHGHDGSACAIRVIHGTAHEMRLGQPDHVWPRGSIVLENEADLVHQIANLGDQPLVCLNVYAPPLAAAQPATTYDGRHVVIVGGGVSGTAAAIHLLQKEGPIRVTIVETRSRLGRGPAYGTSDPTHRLNVPAERMSLFPERSDDFVRWARSRGVNVKPGALLARELFGRYVEDSLARTIATSDGKLWFQRGEAVSVSSRGVRLADGTELAADAVVLATGNQLPAAPPALGEDLLRSEIVIGDPWRDGALDRVGRSEEVLLVGTGLTAIDVLLGLKARGHVGRITAVSRRGLLPAAQLAPTAPRPRSREIRPSELPTTARLLARWIRTECRRYEAEGTGWQCLIDALRPHTTEIWRRLGVAEQRRVMTKLRPFWEIARHRAAPEALATVEASRAEGNLRVIAGVIADASAEGGHARVCLRLSRGRGSIERRVGRIVLCTGPQTDVRRWTSPLFRELLARGVLQSDPLGLGVVTDDLGRPLDHANVASPWLFTLGGLRRPHLWETTAVPELVRQAAALADVLAERLEVAA